jgi:hypothetical protein
VVEHKFHLSNVHKDAFGRCDCVQVASKIIRVYDYKHGAGVAVEIERNPQAMYYALGAILEYAKKDRVIEMVVVQPRCPHPEGAVRRWQVAPSYLFDWRLKTLKPAIAATEQPDAPLHYGKWCQFCRAQALCPKMADETLAIAQADFSDSTISLPNPEHVPLEKLAKIMDFSKILGPYFSEVANYLQHVLETGGEVPGYKLVSKKAKRRWVDEDPTSIAKAAGVEVEQIMKEPELKSPAQVEKIKGVKKKDIADLWESPETGVTIVSESDKRPAVAGSAARDFLEDHSVFQ